MKKSIKAKVASLGTAVMLAAGVAAVSVSSANAAGCSTFAYAPYKAGHYTAAGKAGRSGCTGSPVTIKTRLVHYQPAWANEVLASSSAKAVNWTKVNSWSRGDSKTARGWDFYTAAEANSGAKTESRKVVLWR